MTDKTLKAICLKAEFISGNAELAINMDEDVKAILEKTIRDAFDDLETLMIEE